MIFEKITFIHCFGGGGEGGITYVLVILMNTYYPLIVKNVCNDNGKRFFWNVRDNDIIICVY